MPGAMIAGMGLVVLVWLIPEPHDAGHHDLYHGMSVASNLCDIRTEEDLKLRIEADREQEEREQEGSHGVGLMQAWAIPGVASYSFCLFFCKLIAYTFLYWLPYYIESTEVGGRALTAKEAGDLSVLFDLGGILGGVAAGHLSDSLGAASVVSSAFVFLSVPVLYTYSAFGHVSFQINIALLMTAGFFVNGPYALITTAVSADLGTHESLKGSDKALATVTAIIDGMGSIGAAVGPTAVGVLADLPGGFRNVFIMLYASAGLAGLLLAKLVVKELRDLRQRWAEERAQRDAQAASPGPSAVMMVRASMDTRGHHLRPGARPSLDPHGGRRAAPLGPGLRPKPQQRKRRLLVEDGDEDEAAPLVEGAGAGPSGGGGGGGSPRGGGSAREEPPRQAPGEGEARSGRSARSLLEMAQGGEGDDRGAGEIEGGECGA